MMMAVCVFQVWARQHGLSTTASADGLDGHMLAMLVVHLAERGTLVSWAHRLHHICSPLLHIILQLACLVKGASGQWG